ncbi:unnamed protein product [Rotaria magnacalcarata]|uniref:Methyltransferase FkbM domain-containing protein n=3 Tax=Rotaria magnacalcarata TaxID=392030 RepID=A0A816GM98_9BILA|nr:unnamed protein product [Rotaria magnacalcarata]CAF1677138.1 unnamed protein product [Rotaria magnacalcarata]CAF2006537.1 unnamed protein product [Rotaria magnacalcarata]CAF2102993.1 unnamed protein product [Rotaria magnacalcarata]CAF2183113.1 unnamed protein product [Rotaria magnacalcarata]
MNDRKPTYKLVTLNGRKPYADGDRAQAVVVEHLQLVNTCQEDPSLIVVDIGAFVGDFGLYAAACGCQVYLFEPQPKMIDLIQTSILVNNFSSSRVHLINKAVSHLPSNSQLTFLEDGSDTKQTNGSLHISTIRLDDIDWPPKSNIFLLKIDVEGFELNVLRSAEKLFQNKRIQHLIFEYTAYWTDRSTQKDLLPFVQNQLDSKKLYALDRTGRTVYGPLDRTVLNDFYENHIKRHLQTDIYATFVDSDINTTIKSKPYDPLSSFA